MLSISLVRSWAKMSQGYEIMKRVQDKLQQETDYNEQLKRNLALVESRQYIEKEARNKLNMGKEGETILLLPPISPMVEPTSTPIDISSNWQRWVKLFL